MSNYPLKLEDILDWFRSKRSNAAESDISVADIRGRTEHIPSAAADFDGPGTMGRINGWVTGEFDFEVLRVSDGTDLHWGHAKVSSLQELENHHLDFLQKLRGPDS